jgi:short subunit dehydrogenase-like uncharacterized protein
LTTFATVEGCATITRFMIGIYGANGTLGRLVTARLECAGAPTRLIGRSQGRLANLVPPGTSRPTAIASIDDAPALERALEGCSVLVNCTPAAASGERLVRAALDAGIHYVDAAREQRHIRSVFEKYDEEATQCDVAVVPALGFEYAIGDCLTHLAAQSHQPARTVVIAYAIEGSAVSGTGVRAVATTGPDVVYRDGRWRSVPFEFDRAWFDFPDPLGRRQMSRYGSGEVITVPHHVQTQSVITLITSTSLCPYPVLLPVFPVIRPIARLLRRTPGRSIVGTIAAVLGGSRSGTTTSLPRDTALSRDDRRFMVAVEVHALSGSIGHAVASGGNAYEVTAAILAQGARWLAGGSVVAGVHSPATAFEPHALLNSLANESVKWSAP